MADPKYIYCVIRKDYDMRKHEVWFTAHEGNRIVGRSRTVAHRLTFLGSLIRFDRNLEAAYQAFIRTLAESGWEPVDGEQNGCLQTLRKPVALP